MSPSQEIPADILSRFKDSLAAYLVRAEKRAKGASSEASMIVRAWTTLTESKRPARLGDEERAIVERVTAEAARTTAVCEAIRTRMADLEQGWQPFLPLGSVVRLTRYPDTMSEDEKDRMPTLGSVGVVAGPNFDSHYSLCVGFWAAFRTNDGTAWDPDDPKLDTEDGKPFTYLCDADCLEILEPGRFLDGTPCEAVGVSPTHRRTDHSAVIENEMIVEAGGVHWHFWRFDDHPDVHCFVDPDCAPTKFVAINESSERTPGI